MTFEFETETEIKTKTNNEFDRKILTICDVQTPRLSDHGIESK